MENLPEKSVAESLTPRQLKFLNLIAEGNYSIVDCHRKAGYDGGPHAAYVLKGRLHKELAEIAQARGCSKADVMLELNKINALPVVDRDGNQVQGISMAHKLRVLGLQNRILDGMTQQPQSITFMQINRFDETAKPSEVVDVTPNDGGAVTKAENR